MNVPILHLPPSCRKTLYKNAIPPLLLLASFRLAMPQASGSPKAAEAARFGGYDVVSVKVSKSRGIGYKLDVQDNSVQGENVSLRHLLANAYGLRESLVINLPEWAESARYDLNAKIIEPSSVMKGGKPTGEEARAIYQAELQAILKERFRFKGHETQTMQSIDYLMVSKNGPKLVAVDSGQPHGAMSTKKGFIKADGVPMAALVAMLTKETSRNVIDKTGLKGNYSFELHWAREDQVVVGLDNGGGDSPPALPVALTEQLGLKLTADKGLQPTLVVDSIQKPSPD